MKQHRTTKAAFTNWYVKPATRSNQPKSIPKISRTHQVHKKQWPPIGLRATHLAKHSWIWYPYRHYGTTKANTQLCKTNPLQTIIYPNVPPQQLLLHRWTIRQWPKLTIPVSCRYERDVTGPSETNQYLPHEPLKPVLIWPWHSEIYSQPCTSFNRFKPTPHR
jgi:hypothetical protein